jgi:multidrug efflux pump
VALALAGLVAFRFISVSPLPEIAFAVYASWPGANPETMASAVATPLERQFGRMAGVLEMTSTSFVGNTTITLQFDLSRDINGAARDVQAAINAARGQLPAIPYNPWYRKINPADAPIMFLALTSKTIEVSHVFDAASTIIQPRLAQAEGVGQVLMSGAANPTVRVELNPLPLNKYGISMEQVRSALNQANANGPKGEFSDRNRSWVITANDQLFTASQYKPAVVVYRNGAPVRLSDVADVRDSVEDLRVTGLYDGQPAVLQNIFREPGANIIETVDRLLAAAALARFGAARDSTDGRHASQDADSGLAARGGAESPVFNHSGGASGVSVSAQRMGHHYSQRSGAAVVGRHIRRDVSAELHTRQFSVNGLDHFHRLCRGRRSRPLAKAQT